MGYIPRADRLRPASTEPSAWDMYVATERWDEAENLRPGSTWLAGIVRHDVVAGLLSSSIRADFLPPARRVDDRTARCDRVLVPDTSAPTETVVAWGEEKPVRHLPTRMITVDRPLTEAQAQEIAATFSVPSEIIIGGPGQRVVIAPEGVEWQPWMESETIGRFG
jgi:hypothetical protein